MQNSTEKGDDYSIATEWLTSAEAALYLKINRRTLLQYARQGKVRAYILSGTQRHVWRFKTSDLDAMLSVPAAFLSHGEAHAHILSDTQHHVWRTKSSDSDPVLRSAAAVLPSDGSTTMKRRRHSSGSVLFDKGRSTWRFLQWIDGKRRSQTIGTKLEFPTKTLAWRQVRRVELLPRKTSIADGRTMKALVTRYEAERFPVRHSTARTYRSWLKNHILPKWGDQPLSAIQPQPVELWLRGLALAPKSKTHLRSIMHSLFEFAMFAGVLEHGRNPISLVRNVGATRKVRQARSLTVEQFQALLKELPEPFETLALCCATMGLRISEALGLRWGDIDWRESRINIERGIVAQHVDATKTRGSQKTMSIARELLEHLRLWKRRSQFRADTDWIFASPVKIGRLPYSYNGVLLTLQRAADAAGIGKLATHAFRHSFRTWLNQTGAPIATQQKLMRHSSIAMTMDTYGTTFDPELTAASSKVAERVFTIGSPNGITGFVTRLKDGQRDEG
jgi:integrase